MKRRKSAAVWLVLKRCVTLPVAISKRGKEIDDAVPSVIVRVSHGAARAQREGRLRALQRLDRRLLVDTEHNRVLGRVEVEPDDIA